MTGLVSRTITSRRLALWRAAVRVATLAAMTDTWTSRDLPVLIAAAEHLEDSLGKHINSTQLAQMVDLGPVEVERACRALVPTYLEGSRTSRMNGGSYTLVKGLTDDGRRAVGMWPDRGDHLAALIAALAQAEQTVDDEEERTKLQKVRDALSRAPKRITEQVVAGVIAGQIGGL